MAEINLKQIQLGGDLLDSEGKATYPEDLSTILGREYRFWVNNNEDDPGIFTIGNRGNIVRISGVSEDPIWRKIVDQGIEKIQTDFPIVVPSAKVAGMSVEEFLGCVEYQKDLNGVITQVGFKTGLYSLKNVTALGIGEWGTQPSASYLYDLLDVNENVTTAPVGSSLIMGSDRRWTFGTAGTDLTVYRYTNLDGTFNDNNIKDTFNAYTIATKFKQHDQILNSLGSNYVTISGAAQTISSPKTFSSAITLVSNPTANMQATTKLYVDSTISTAISGIGVNNFVTLTTAQDITGQKTFKSGGIIIDRDFGSPYVDFRVLGITKGQLSTDNNGVLYWYDSALRTVWHSGNLNPANYVTLDSAQTIAGNKSFTGKISVPTATVATDATSKSYVDSSITNAINGLGLANYVTLGTSQTITGAKYFTTTIRITASNPGIIIDRPTGTPSIDFYSNGILNGGIGISSAKEFLFYDTAWRTIYHSGNLNVANLVTLTGEQTISGQKTFSSGGMIIYSASGSPFIDFRLGATSRGVLSVESDGSLRYYDTALRTIWHSGNFNIANYVTIDTAQTISGNKTFTGKISVPAATVATDATPKSYVDDSITNAINAIGLQNYVTLGSAQTITAQKVFSVTPIFSSGSISIRRTDINPYIEFLYNGTKAGDIVVTSTKELLFYDTVANRTVYHSGNLNVANLVTVSSNQTISGLKTFSAGGIIIDRASGSPYVDFRIAGVMRGQLSTDTAGIMYWYDTALRTVWHSGNFNPSNYVTIGDAQTISGNKTFTGKISVPAATVNTDATPKSYVDSSITNAINGIGLQNYVSIGTAQTITGQKTFTSQIIAGSSSTGIVINRPTGTPSIDFQNANTLNGAIGVSSAKQFLFYDTSWKTVWHSGNSNLSTVNWASQDLSASRWVYGNVGISAGGGYVDSTFKMQITTASDGKGVLIYNPSGVANGRRFAFNVSTNGRSYIGSYGDNGTSNARTNIEFDSNGINYARDILPQANNTFVLGNNANRWANIYGVLGNFSNALTCYNLETNNTAAPANARKMHWGTANNGTGQITARNDDGSLKYSFITFNTDGTLQCRQLAALGNNTYDLGTNGTRWRTVYAVAADFYNLVQAGDLAIYNSSGIANSRRFHIYFAANNSLRLSLENDNITTKIVPIELGQDGIVRTTSIYPSVSSANIGGTSNRWANIYGVLGNFSGNTFVANVYPNPTGGDCGNINYRWGQVYSTIGNFSNTVTAGNVNPTSNGAGSIGFSTLRWGNVYTAYLSSSGNIDVNGYGTFIGGAGTSSDMRFKKNIQDIALTLDDIVGIDIFKYDWLYKENSSYTTIGTNGNKLEEHDTFRHFVRRSSDEERLLTVDYSKLSLAVAVEGIKLLKSRIEDLERRLNQ